MLQYAAGLSMAGPMFVVGFEFVRTGRLVGGVGFLALGAVALYFPTYLVKRIGGPRTWLRRRLGRVRTSGDSSAGESETGTNASSDTPTTTSLLERIRRR
ncbi:hypothetical protein [Halopiger aswanensis]